LQLFRIVITAGDWSSGMARTAEPLDIGEALRCARFLLTAYAWPRTPARLVQHRRHLELLTATGRFTRETSRSDVDTQWISTAEAATILDVFYSMWEGSPPAWTLAEPQATLGFSTGRQSNNMLHAETSATAAEPRWQSAEPLGPAH
jgi:hypothetical protein